MSLNVPPVCGFAGVGVEVVIAEGEVLVEPAVEVFPGTLAEVVADVVEDVPHPVRTKAPNSKITRHA